MFRKLVALLPLAAAFIAAADAGATTLDTWGSGVNADPDDWNAPTEAPHAFCQSLMLYLADVPADATKLRRYRFTGTCTINVAREKKLAKMVKLDVLVDAEYHPGIKRASERVTVKHPDLSLDLSTWATCPTDPFVGTNVTCTNKGMGATKWDKFINKEDAPFARQRATAGQVDDATKTFALAKERGAAPTSFWVNPTLQGIKPIAKTGVGLETVITIDVQGGAGMCPMELEFADGTPKQSVILWSQSAGGVPFKHTVIHKFPKPGFFKVAARTLPGCGGEHIAYALVK